MKISFNGEPREVSGATLALALDELGLSTAVVATALNGSFVPAPSRSSISLKDGDAVEALAPMQGG
ncbi:sulfur carrier protein ThiS [Rubellimicrobium roseum]|uniref:Sulfur carrier protein ThiS n=1 Tax=Rubellimicrobium roseum TaxID=687525 RepID=A0A5C4N6K1_9RHOB|nr:sulfur carrier protein ThiS [Rubellimicrobium roseum]TNC60992.1 sulfur carrier protein ThiS [Rubellimicrobium roseum]